MTCDFTYDHWIDCVKSYKGDLIIRHDVDFDLNKALQHAEIEHEHKIKSIYFILLDSDYYNPFSEESTETISKIINLGHEIGIHCNPGTPLYLQEQFRLNFNIANIKITAHKPNLYGYTDREYKPKGYKYISDSGMNWREGCMCNHSDEKKLYVNTHPVWWNTTSGNRFDRMMEISILKSTESHERIMEEYNRIRYDYIKRISR